MGCSLKDNHLYIFGGYSGDGISSHVARYNIATKEWEILPSMPGTLAAMGVSVIGNNTYLVGGWADDGRAPQSQNFCYRE